MDFAKNLLTQNTEETEHCDPYVAFTFAGQMVKTSVKQKTFTPEFNEELKVGFKFPSMCERIKLQVLDWDRLGKDECIATSFISLQAITGLGDPGTNIFLFFYRLETCQVVKIYKRNTI